VNRISVRKGKPITDYSCPQCLENLPAHTSATTATLGTLVAVDVKTARCNSCDARFEVERYDEQFKAQYLQTPAGKATDWPDDWLLDIYGHETEINPPP